MKTLEDALLKVKENPNKYIGKKSLEKLTLFIAGYALSQAEETGTYPELKEKFSRYIEKKYNVKECIGILEIIRRVSYSDEDAFDKYYELLQEFYSEDNLEELL